MKTSKIFLIIGSILLLTACNTAESENENHTQKVMVTDSFDLGIVLNEGEKWPINEEMMPFIKSSKQRLQNYHKDTNADYLLLATALKKNNNQLISNCTMTGKSHDALHLWLLPHLALVGELQKATTAKEAAVTIEKLNYSFAAFDYYFE